MGRGIKLGDNQFDQLDHLRFSTDCADVFRNCLIILMSDAGDTIALIALRVGYSTFTVKRVRQLYRTGDRLAAADQISRAGPVEQRRYFWQQ